MQPTRYLLWGRRHIGASPFDLALSGMASVTRRELGAPESLDDLAGWGALRQAIAKYNDVPATEAVATLGTTQALWLACATLLSPGDEVLVEEPAYEPLYRIAENLGAKVKRFTRSAKAGYALDPAEVGRALTTRTRLVIVSNLHNPSGVRADAEALREVAALVQGRGAYLLVDEVYAPFDLFVGDDGVFTGSARKLGGNVITVGSLTKCYGLGVDRIGWVLGPKEFIEAADQAVISTMGMLPLSHAHHGVHAFAKLGELSVRARKLLGKKREKAAAFVASRPDLSWTAPEAGLFGFVTSSRAGDLTSTIEAGVQAHGVVVVPGAFFGVPNAFRLAWSLDESKLDEALVRLGKVLPGGA